MSDTDGLLFEFTEPEPEPARAEGWDSANGPRPPHMSSITIGVTDEQLVSASLSSGARGGAEVPSSAVGSQPEAEAKLRLNLKVGGLGSEQLEGASVGRAPPTWQDLLGSLEAPFSNEVIEQGFKKFCAVPPFKFDAVLAEHESAASDEGMDDPKHDEQSETSKELKEEGDDAMSETNRKLEQLQIETVYSLVEHLPVDIGGAVSQKRLLFLSNQQAGLFDFKKNVDKILTGMDIPPPKLIINLQCSYVSWGYDFKAGPYATHVNFKSDSRDPAILSHHTHGEESARDLVDYERRLGVFFEQELIPVAVRTHAIVMVSVESCILSSVFCELSAEYAKTMPDGKLPFTIITCGNAVLLHKASETKGTVSHCMKRASRHWTAASKHIGAALIKGAGPEQMKWPAQAILGGSTHFILVDGVTKGRMDISVPNDFKTSFAQALSNTGLPSLTIGTGYIYDDSRGRGGTLHSYTAAADVVSRGLPYLMLDTRRTPPGGYAERVSDAQAQLEALQKKLTLAGTLNWLTYATIAHLKLVVTKAQQAEARERRRQNGEARPDHPEQRGLSIHAVIETIEADERETAKRQYDLDSGPGADASSPTKDAVAVLEKIDMDQTVVLICWRMELLVRAIKELASVRDAQQLDEWLHKKSVDWRFNFWVAKWMDGLLEDLGPRAKTSLQAEASEPEPEGGEADRDRFIVKKRGIRNGELFCFTMALRPDLLERPGAAAADIERMKSAIRQKLQHRLEAMGGTLTHLATGGGYFGSKTTRALWQTLESPLLYAANVDNLKHLSQIVAQIARIDRLPDRNSNEAMFTLKDAWDHVDIYTHLAHRSKVIAQVAYFLLLAVSFATCVVVQISLNQPEHLSEDVRISWVTGLSLGGAMIAAITSYQDPANRWMQLRGAALALECEIWKYRTRSGDYALHGTSEIQSEEAEQNLLQSVEVIAAHVGKAASVSDTAFFSRFNIFGTLDNYRVHKKYTHGQHSGCSVSGTFGKANTNMPAKAKEEAAAEAAAANYVPSKGDRMWKGKGRAKVKDYVQVIISERGAKNKEEQAVQTAKNKLYNGKIAQVVQDAGKDASIDATPYTLKFEHATEGEEGLTEEQAVAEFKDAHVKPPPVKPPTALDDDHHSPLNPQAYIKLRVVPQVRFYQTRLPQYSRRRAFSETTMVVGSLSGTFMALLGVDRWCAVAAALVAMHTAWAAFSGYSKKLTRYSNTVEKVHAVMRWWNQLTPVDRSNVAKINEFVTTCEDLFEREREAWGVSASKVLSNGEEEEADADTTKQAEP